MGFFGLCWANCTNAIYIYIAINKRKWVIGRFVFVSNRINHIAIHAILAIVWGKIKSKNDDRLQVYYVKISIPESKFNKSKLFERFSMDRRVCVCVCVCVCVYTCRLSFSICLLVYITSNKVCCNAAQEIIPLKQL